MSTTYNGRVLLGVTGCIAAYKACEILRGLQKAGYDVYVAVTHDALQFVGETSFEALSGHPVLKDLYSYPENSIPHIHLPESVDLFLVAPATANILAKMAYGIADDALTSALLAADSPVLVAPAMNVRMWQNPATQQNIATLRERGIRFASPVAGYLACGDIGEGKLAEVDTIVQAACEIMQQKPGLLDGKRVIITAGPTHEAIDPVRYIANDSSGKMGYAIAEALARRGAETILISGPTALSCPEGVTRVDVVSARDMLDASLEHFGTADAAICAAAVADYRPKSRADKKLKKQERRLDTIELEETDDILATLSSQKDGRVVIGFAAETGHVLDYAQDKLKRKGCDLIVANDISRADSAFGSDTDKVAFVSPDGITELPTLPKTELAELICDRLQTMLGL